MKIAYREPRAPRWWYHSVVFAPPRYHSVVVPQRGMCRVDTLPQRGTSRRLKRDAGSRTDVPERHSDVPERHTTAWYKKARIRSLVVPQRSTQPLVVHGACDLGTAIARKRGKGAQRGERGAGGHAGSGGQDQDGREP